MCTIVCVCVCVSVSVRGGGGEEEEGRGGGGVEEGKRRRGEEEEGKRRRGRGGGAIIHLIHLKVSFFITFTNILHEACCHGNRIGSFGRSCNILIKY